MFAQLADRLSHGGQGRIGQGRERNVVEADDRDVAWDEAAEGPRGLERAERHQVIQHEYGGKPWGLGEQLQCGLAATFDLVVTVQGWHSGPVDGHTRFAQHIEEARLTIGHAFVKR